MHRARTERVRNAMQAADIDVLVLCGQQNVAYAIGALAPAADHMRAACWRSVAIIVVGEDSPRLFTASPNGWVDECAALAAEIPAGRLALDDAPFPLWEALAVREPVDAAVVLGPAKIIKTDDELECIRRAQMINEAAIAAVRPQATPGTPSTAVSCDFLAEVIERGATANTVDPVLQVMRPSGAPIYPIPTRAEPFNEGDVVWVDTGINLHGYASDFGATWIIGCEPNARQRDQFARWRAVVDRALEAVRPGATARDLTRAVGDERPWLPYFYLAHGVGTDSAEMPFVGTDLGDDFDEALVLAPGMVLVFEPVIWDDGFAGHRSEEIVAVTDTGYRWLSSRAEFG
jgi:Xaa-Pro aminopeptidase